MLHSCEEGAKGNPYCKVFVLQEENAKLKSELDTTRKSVVRLREAAEKLKGDYEHYLEGYEDAKSKRDKRLRDLNETIFVAHLNEDLPVFFKALSTPIQDIEAWDKARLLEAEARGVDWGKYRNPIQSINRRNELRAQALKLDKEALSTEDSKEKRRN